MDDIKVIKNLPNEKIGELFRISPKNNPFSMVDIYTAGYNTKDVFEVLKNRLPIWSNSFYAKIVGQTFGYIIFMTLLIVSGYAFYENSPLIIGVILWIATLLVLYFCLRNILYFLKLKKY